MVVNSDLVRFMISREGGREGGATSWLPQKRPGTRVIHFLLAVIGSTVALCEIAPDLEALRGF